MIRDLDRAIVDEVQLAPDLLRAIKESVDNDRLPGRFSLTGSANILTLQDLRESRRQHGNCDPAAATKQARALAWIGTVSWP
jgi:hypothetical protein